MPSVSQRSLAILAAAAGSVLAAAGGAQAVPTVSRLTPPSNLFRFSDVNAPIVARFLPGQAFDVQATVSPDAGRSITDVRFFLDGVEYPATLAPATAAGLPAGTRVATLRAYRNTAPGVHPFSAIVRQDDGQAAKAVGNYEIVGVTQEGRVAKNLIVLIGDGMGIAHRTAARILLGGIRQGKITNALAMDTFPVTGLVVTHSLNSIVTDSSPGAACYSTGNKSNNNQHGVFPDDTLDVFDNPRVESIGEYLKRTQNKSLGIVTTSDVFDATPGAFASHTQNRGAGTGIVDQYFDERNNHGLTVLLGGGRKWFLPAGTPGSQRTAITDSVLPPDLASAYGVPPGAVDPGRDLLQDFVNDGWYYAPTGTALSALPANATKLLGLFAFSNMNVALDKIAKRRAPQAPGVVDDYGFPDQPLLDEMTTAALRVLQKNTNGFVLMVEAASIDKQAHNMDTERWLLDTVEFDRAIGVSQEFAQNNPDTLVIVTADHECAGVNIIGASTVTNADLTTRAANGGGAGQLRAGVVGTYEAAGFPVYTIAPDGYPVTLDVDRKMLIGYAANADRYEDWLTNTLPLRDSQQPFNNTAPLNTYPNGPLNRDTAGNFLVTGQVSDGVAAHTASDIPVSAFGRGAGLFTGVMDNTDVFFKMMQAALGGVR